jgi:gliding motility-associated-like protein
MISITPSAPSICAGDSIGLGASGAVTYTWSPSAGISVSTGDSVIANSPGNTYTITGANTYGCTGKTSVTVNLAPPPVMSVSPPASLVCIGSNTTLNAQGASNYSWQPATGLNVTNDSSVTVTPTITTTYTVTGTSNLGCIDSTTVVVTLATLPLDSFFMIVPSDCNPQQVQFADTLPGAISYLWNFGDSSTAVSPNPLHTYIIPGMYRVKLTVTDSAGCIDTASVEETILAEGYVAVPNAFIPEGSTSNSFFTPHMLCPDYSGYSFNVYSRWGQLLFQTNDATQGWDGTYNGAPEQVGVYIYYITFDCGNCPLIMRGNITLLR